MDMLTKKTLKSSRGFKYTYYISPASPGKHTLLLLHGWPDNAALWQDLATKHLVPSGCGVVIPDCLGFDGTDKPTDPASYVLSGQTQDMCDILDAEGVGQVVAVGHDWGAMFASRMWIWRPERCVGLITFSVPYFGAPLAPMDTPALQQTFDAHVGYYPYHYWDLFADAARRPQVMGQHAPALYDIMHTAERDLWIETFCKKDGLRNWCLQDRTCDVQDYAKAPGAKQAFLDRMARDGFAAPVCWYVSHAAGHQLEVEKTLPPGRAVVDVPYLYVVGLQDRVCLPGALAPSKAAGYLPKLTELEMDAGHWIMKEKPEETGKLVLNWIATAL